MKRTYFLFLLALLPIAANAYDIYLGGIYYNLGSNKTATVTYGQQSQNSYSGSISIPNEIRYNEVTYKVTSIGVAAFRKCENLSAVIVPNSVTYIGPSAFINCCNLQQVTLSNSINKIDEFTFNNCSSLKSIVVPNSVTLINRDAFSGCTSLVSITLSNSLETIGYCAFEGCNALTSIKIPSSVKTIKVDAFKNCTGLKKVIVPNLTAWCNIEFEKGEYRFDFRSYGNPLIHAQHLYSDENTEIKDLVIPQSITAIGNYTFMGCCYLNSVKIHDKVTSIGMYAFINCSGLTTVRIPDNVTSIGDFAFKNCNNLTSLNLSNKIEKIGSWAFSECQELTSLIIPDSIKTIGIGSFNSCSKISTISIGKNIKTVNSSAFSQCTSLTKMYCYAENVPSTTYDAFNNVTLSKATLYVPKASIEAYKAAEPWKDFGTFKSINDDEVTLKAKSYSRVYGDANPTFGYEVTEGTITSGTPTITCSATKTSPVGTYDIVISKGSVSNSTVNLVKGTLTITKAPLTISAGNYTKQEGEANPTFTPTFSGFKNSETKSVLTTQPTITTTATTSSPAGKYLVTISGAAAQNYAIGYINGTLTVTAKPEKEIIQFASDVMKRHCVQRWDTDGDGELSTAEAAAVKDFGRDRYTIGLTFNEFKYFTGLTTIPDSTFYNWSGMTSIIIPKNVTSIGKAVFMFCSGLISIDIPNSVKRIGDYSFSYCPKLESLTIPNSVTTIGNNAFSGCNCLTSITIPNSVTSIGEFAFEYCRALSSITMSNSITTISKRAFWECSNLTSVTIPSSVTTIESGAFRRCYGLTSVYIPSSVTKIGSEVFWECSNLTSVYVERKTPTQIDYYTFGNRANATLYVPKGCKAAYLAAEYWKEFKEIKEMGAEETPGDLNGDGDVNGTDLVTLTNLILSGDTNTPAADMNGDGIVNGTDYVMLVNKILGKAAAPRKEENE